jgi:hypothetical protein
MCSNVSGLRQKEQSEFEDIAHLFRFLRVGRELLMYRMVKLQMFFGSFDWAMDHTLLS